MTDESREEAEILADEQAAPDELAPEDDKTDYIEFLGTDPAFGTQFYGAGVVGHTVTRKHLKDAHDVTTPKDLQWSKAAAGKHKGRMLLPVEGISQDTLDILENDPMFKRVSL